MNTKNTKSTKGEKLSIVLRIGSPNRGVMRVKISAVAIKNRTRFTLTAVCIIRSLSTGLKDVGRIIEDRVLPQLQDLMTRHEKPDTETAP